MLRKVTKVHVYVYVQCFVIVVFTGVIKLEHNQINRSNILHNNPVPLRLNYKYKDKGAAYK